MGLTALLMLVVSAPGSTAKAILVGNLDQIQVGTGGTATIGYGLDNVIVRYQEFKPTFDNIIRIELDFYKTGSPGGTVTVEIKDKTGSTSLGSVVFSEAGILNGWNSVDFASTINVTPGTIYRIYVYTTGATINISNYISWWGNGSGTSTYSCSPVDCQTDKYGINPDFDYRFKTWGDPAIFSDGFESGNLSAWSGKVGARISDPSFGTEALCKLCVRMKGALAGSYSLKVRIPDKKPHFLKDSSPIWVKTYTGSFIIKVGKTLQMDHLNKFTVFQGRQGKKVPFLLQVRKKGTIFQIRALVRKDGGGYLKTSWALLPKAATKVTVGWGASSGAGANNGFVVVFLNDIMAGTVYYVDNDQHVVNYIRLGVTAPIKALYNISGAFKLDDFISTVFVD